MLKLTNKIFIEKAKKIHGDKYDYSLVKYANSKIKIEIICKMHGVFKQKPNNHLSNHGCPMCGVDSIIKLNKQSNTLFIEKARKIHKDKYNYSLVKYNNNHTKIEIICKKHGVFKQKPNAHLNNQGCPDCGYEKLTTYNLKTKEDFINEANLVHNNKYDYKLVDYKKNNVKVNIICKKHGEFSQTPNNHLNKHGCLDCGIERVKNKLSSNDNDYIEKARKIHKDKYCYDSVKYINCFTKVIIECKKHGYFYQKPSNHLSGRGCPICNESKGEKEIKKYLEKNNILFEREKKFDMCKNVFQLPFDFYLPKHNLLIEYDGEQHFKSINYWGGDKKLLYTKNNDKIKNKFASKEDIKLLRISYTQYKNIDNILNSNLEL